MTPTLSIALFAVLIACMAVGIALIALRRPGITLVVDPDKLVPTHPEQPFLAPLPGTYLPYSRRPSTHAN